MSADENPTDGSSTDPGLPEGGWYRSLRAQDASRARDPDPDPDPDPNAEAAPR